MVYRLNSRNSLARRGVMTFGSSDFVAKGARAEARTKVHGTMSPNKRTDNGYDRQFELPNTTFTRGIHSAFHVSLLRRRLSDDGLFPERQPHQLPGFK